MDLRETLIELSVLAQLFKNGTQITEETREQHATATEDFADLARAASSLGATPYQIERACAGEIVEDFS